MSTYFSWVDYGYLVMSNLLPTLRCPQEVLVGLQGADLKRTTWLAIDDAPLRSQLPESAVLYNNNSRQSCLAFSQEASAVYYAYQQNYKGSRSSVECHFYPHRACPSR